MMAGTIEIQFVEPGLLLFKAKARLQVMIDGDEMGTAKMGDTVRFAVQAGQHELRVVMDVALLTRRTKPLQLGVADDETTRVSGTYSHLWGKYVMSLSR
jgi:hypothetical protein